MKKYRPPSSALKIRVMLFSELVSVSVAFGSTAPEGSVTTPESVAVVVAICALIHGALLVNMASRIANPPQLQRDCGLRLLFVFKIQPPSGFRPVNLGPRRNKDASREIHRDRDLKSDLSRLLNQPPLRPLRHRVGGSLRQGATGFSPQGSRTYQVNIFNKAFSIN